jgi:hypothetical protein
MAMKEEDESDLELFDVAKKEKVAKAPLGETRLIPRTGAHFHFASATGRLRFLYRRGCRVLAWLRSFSGRTVPIGVGRRRSSHPLG